MAPGSPEYKVSNPEEKGHDDVPVKSVEVAPDGKSVFLTVDGLRPVMQMRIQIRATAVDGAPLKLEIYNTVHRVP